MEALPSFPRSRLGKGHGYLSQEEVGTEECEGTEGPRMREPSQNHRTQKSWLIFLNFVPRLPLCSHPWKSPEHPHPKICYLWGARRSSLCSHLSRGMRKLTLLHDCKHLLCARNFVCL